MKEILMDPQVAGPAGIIVVGVLLLFWALKRLLRSKPAPSPVEFDFPLPRQTTAPTPPLSVVSPDANPFAGRTPTPAAAPLNRDVLVKVDLISQRLTDMQLLLNKQLSASSAGTPGGGGAPTLSPEMLDKLIKITGSVAEQVDILQKSIRAAEPDAAPEPATSASPAPGA